MPNDAPTEPNRCSSFPCAFPIKVMGRTQDGFAQAIVTVVQKHAPDFDPGDARDARVERGQVPVVHVHGQRDLARRSSTISIAISRRTDGDDGAVAVRRQRHAPAALRDRGATLRRRPRDSRSAAPSTRRRGARCRRSPTARTAATPDEIWLTEHPPVYTLGLAGRREHLLRDNGIPALKVDRGGQITYHGPGQLVVYLLFDLRRPKLGRPRDGPDASRRR